MTQRILIVEDSTTQREKLRLLLQDAGYEVAPAEHGEEALARFDPDRDHLVISDIVMPGEVNGYDLCRRIKAGAGRHVPVMLLTSLADPLDIINGLECGADNFLTKPYQPEHLLERIRALLTIRQARTAARLQVGVDVYLLGRKFTINSDREQILDLLISTFEDAVLQNRALREREEQIERSRRSMAGLYQLAVDLNGGRTEQEVANVALERALNLPGVQAGWVSLRGPDDSFRLVAARQLPPALEAPGALEGECTCRRMLLQGEFDSAVNITTCDRLRTTTEDTRGLRYHASVPLWVGDRALGIMNLAGPSEGMFSDEDLQVLHGVGNQIAVALERASLHEQLKQRVEERTAQLETETTVRQRAEEKLDIAQRERLAILEAIPDIVYLLDTEGRLVRWNRRLQEVSGHPEDRLSQSAALDLIAQDTRAGVATAIASAMNTGYAEIEADLLTADGRTIPYHLIGVPMRSEQGEVIGLTGVGRDLTRYKKLEQQLRQAQKLEAIGRLTSGIAHDFNNVLTAISGYTDMLLDDEQLTATQRHDLEQIEAASARAVGLTGQLLAFSRQQIVKPRVLDLNQVVAGTEGMLQQIVGEDIALTTALAADLGRVRADAGQLEQVILNLVVNAKDAMPRGGHVTIETANVELDADYAQDHVSVIPGQYVRLAVSDTGIGMDAATQANIFEPFFTTKGPREGTGLGLATVHGIVEQSNGHVSVYSEAGQGATFKVYLPRVDEALSAPTVQPEPPGRLGGTETIVLVEDNEPVRRLMVTILRGQNYTVYDFGHPADALVLASTIGKPAALLISDVVMPGMNGRELAEQLQAMWPGLRVLYMSGYTDDAIVKHGVLGGELQFLGKPFTAGLLLSKVRSVLDGPA